jgi:hypothetical protein
VTAEEHLAEVLSGVGPALRAVGWEGEAARVESLNGPLDVEDAFELLDSLGPKLVHAYVRAGGFLRRAHPGIRQDAVRFQRDLFHARCWVSVARQAARRVLRGEALLMN